MDIGQKTCLPAGRQETNFFGHWTINSKHGAEDKKQKKEQ